jgi:uncharacterized protein
MGTGGTVLVGAVMAVGLFGTVVPVMPGLAVIWGAGLVYGLAGEFAGVGAGAFAVMTVLLVGGTIASYALPHRAGRMAGASTTSLRTGVLFAVIGFFAIPVVGLVLGGVAGVFLGEYQRFRDPARAWQSTRLVLLGFGAGMLTEVACGVGMILAWLLWVAAG